MRGLPAVHFIQVAGCCLKRGRNLCNPNIARFNLCIQQDFITMLSLSQHETQGTDFPLLDERLDLGRCLQSYDLKEPPRSMHNRAI